MASAGRFGAGCQALLGGIEEGAWVLWAGKGPLLFQTSLSGLITLWITQMVIFYNHVSTMRQGLCLPGSLKSSVMGPRTVLSHSQGWELFIEWMDGSVGR